MQWVRCYFWNLLITVLISVGQMINTVLGGDPDEPQ